MVRCLKLCMTCWGKAHSGSYPWRAACSRCLKDAARTTGWVKLGRRVCQQLPVRDPAGNIRWEDDLAAQ
eukprot:2052482-Heterocapsa_arctica.AAC.1